MISAPDRGSRVQALIPIARARNAFEIKRESCGSFISPTPVHSRRETGHIYRIKLRLSSWCPIIPAEAREDVFCAIYVDKLAPLLLVIISTAFIIVHEFWIFWLGFFWLPEPLVGRTVGIKSHIVRSVLLIQRHCLIAFAKTENWPRFLATYFAYTSHQINWEFSERLTEK